MTSEQWIEVKEVFSAAVSMPPEARKSFLSRLDPAIQQEVTSLLLAYEREAEALEQPLLTTSGRLLGKALEANFERDEIGPYKVIAEIGRGGMGAVYRAVRGDNPGVEYAIKIIRPELNQDLLVKRFQQELRILRKLQHPYIAGVLDSGTTENGEPFFVMDLVKGLPLDEHCDANMLSIKERLVLFQKVCEAVGAAHSLGVVHRDLKPSNVLVTRAGEPRLLDFGIAKVVSPDDYTQTILATQTTYHLMTPEYASPEQICGEPVSMQSDIYSLGVLLYELLTGFRPYTVTRKDPGAIARAISEQEPARPSSRFPRFTTAWGPARRGANTEAEIASARRASTPRLLRRNLRGKLDNIVMKALAKSPGERYESVAQFSNDIAFYLAHRPVIARAEPVLKRAGTVLRSRTALIAVVLAASALCSIMALRLTMKREYLDFSNARLTSLFSSSDLERQPVLSPDGKRLAFVWARSPERRAQIYLSTADGEAPEAITADPAEHFAPAWSPDGIELAFLQVDNGQTTLWRAPAHPGATPHRVASLSTSKTQDLGLPVVWSPDGRHLLISDMSAKGNLAIFRVDSQTGKRSQITWPPADSIGDASPRVSPDGRRLAFIRTRNGGNSRIYVQDLAAGEARALPFEALWASGLSWAPDGRALILSSVTGAQAGLWMISIDGRRSKRLPASETGILDPFLSADGKQLVYCLETQDDNIWRLNLVGAGRATEDSIVIDSPAIDAEPSISPDGKQLAFTSELSGSPQIWTSDLNGKARRQLTHDSAWLANLPAWSADGKQVLFSASSQSPFHLFVVPVDAGAPRRVTNTDNIQEEESRWSHDGRSIFFDAVANGQSEIWQVQPPDRTPRQLTVAGGKSPRESRDGRYLYYVKGASHTPSRAPVKRSIWRIPLPRGPEEKVIDIDADTWGGWDLARQGFYYIAGEPNATLYYYDFASLEKSAVHELGHVDLDQEWLSLSPDERFLYYVKIDQLRRRIMSLRRE